MGKFRKIFIIFLLITLSVFLLPQAGWGNETSFIWPVEGKVITPFSLDSHRGIDIEASVGSSIVSTADGVIYWIGKTPRGEPYVSIQHNGGLRTTYIPVEATVTKGQAIKQDEAIGLLSNTGEVSSPIPHLHFGVKVEPYGSKDYLDPLTLLPVLTLGDHKSESPITEEAVTPIVESLPVVLEEAILQPILSGNELGVSLQPEVIEVFLKTPANVVLAQPVEEKVLSSETIGIFQGVPINSTLIETPKVMSDELVKVSPALAYTEPLTQFETKNSVSVPLQKLEETAQAENHSESLISPGTFLRFYEASIFLLALLLLLGVSKLYLRLLKFPPCFGA